MLVSSVLEKCINDVFPHMGGNLGSKFLSRQAYQDAANHVFEKRKDNCLEIMKFLRVLIKYKGITRNNIGENIKFYRVVSVIPPKNYV